MLGKWLGLLKLEVAEQKVHLSSAVRLGHGVPLGDILLSAMQSRGADDLIYAVHSRGRALPYAVQMLLQIGGSVLWRCLC